MSVSLEQAQASLSIVEAKINELMLARYGEKSEEWVSWRSSLMHLSHAQHESEQANKCLSGIVAAWESLPGGYYGPGTIEKWLSHPMYNAINAIRKFLGVRHG